MSDRGWRQGSVKLSGPLRGSPTDTTHVDGGSALNELVKKLTKKPSRSETVRLVAAFVESQLDACSGRAVGPLVSRGSSLAQPSTSFVPWAKIFHQRMLCTLEPLGAEATAALADAVRSCGVEGGGPQQQQQLSHGAARALEGLSEYLSSHSLDPDNALLGVGVAASVVAAQAGTDSHLAFGTGRLGSSEATHIALAHCVEAVCSWAAMADRDLCAAARAWVADGMPPALRLLRRGTLVVARLGKRAVFCRVSGGGVRLDGSAVSVTADPFEQAAPREVPIDDVAVFPARMAAQLATTVLISRLAANPCQDILDVVLVDARALLVAQVVQLSSGAAALRNGFRLDAEQVRRVLRTGVRLREISAVDAVLRALTAILTDDEALARFVNAANVPFVEKIPPFLDAVNRGETALLPLTKRESLRGLQDADILQIVRDMVEVSRQKCQATLESLRAEFSEIRSGQQKRRVTEWYLRFIHEAVDEFLALKGFDSRAVPVDYMERPPENLEVVARNLAIVRKLLEGSRKDPDTVSLLERTCSRVYSELDDFVDSMKYVLSVELDLPLRESIVTDSISKIAQIAASDAKDPRIKSCNDMIKDLQYVTRMKELESTEKANSLDVVPVSGLILSRFTRFENETQTVLQLWVKPQQQQPSPPQQQQQHDGLAPPPPAASPPFPMASMRP